MTSDAYQSVLTALCIFREAQNQPTVAMQAVYWVIQNRITMGRWGSTAADVILAHRQFSSFNPDDPNAHKLPLPTDKAWLECCDVVDNPGDDPTSGATHYFSVDIPAPGWADPNRETCRLGAFRFFKLP